MRALIVIGLLLVLIGCGMPTNEASVELAWSPPTANEDGTPVTDLAGYKVHQSTRPGEMYAGYTAVIDVGLTTTYTVMGLLKGQTYYFAVTAYDTAGNESEYSNEVWKAL